MPSARTGQQFALSREDRRHLDAFERQLDFIRDRVTSVAERYQVGCYLVGPTGTSKTRTVLSTLADLDRPHAYRNSRMSPAGLYEFLEEHNEHAIVLDDIPSLLSNRQALQVVMAALGGEPDRPRCVTWTIKSDEERKSCQFIGGIIAISNVPLRRNPLCDAVFSRVVTLEHSPTDQQLAAFMRSQAIKGYKDLQPPECLEVAEFVIAESRASDYRLDLRCFSKALEDYRLVAHKKARRTWQELVKSSIKQIVQLSNRDLPISRAERIARQRDLARELFRRFPTDKQRRDKEWAGKTGLSPDSLYRRRRET